MLWLIVLLLYGVISFGVLIGLMFVVCCLLSLVWFDGLMFVYVWVWLLLRYGLGLGLIRCWFLLRVFGLYCALVVCY